MVLWLPGPGSYTGEDSAELYLHGGRAVMTGVADALVALGASPAEPGEFTRRAFLNGRMDLTEAEAVHDLSPRRPRHNGDRRCANSMARWGRSMAAGRIGCAYCWPSRRR